MACGLRHWRSDFHCGHNIERNDREFFVRRGTPAICNQAQNKTPPSGMYISYAVLFLKKSDLLSVAGIL